MAYGQNNNFIKSNNSQGYMNIGSSSAPNIDEIKRDILYDALYYNIRQQEAKTIKKHVDRERQIEDYKLINKRVSTQLNEDILKERNKKSYFQSLLAQQYDKQIQAKRQVQDQEARKNKNYAITEQQSQKNYYDRRARQLARIYRGQKTFQSINPETQQMMKQSKFPHQRYEQKNYTEIADSRVSYSPQNYKDYLKQQIERKKHQKQEQVRNRLQIQKQLAKLNYEKIMKEKDELRQIHRKQQLIYRKGLDEQIEEKNYFKHNF